MIYWLLLILILTLGFFEVILSQEKEARQVFSILFYAILTVLLILGTVRWRRGTDWMAYYGFFMDPWESWEAQHIEPGYALLNKVVRSLTDSYTVFLGIETLLYLVLLVATIYSAVALCEGRRGSTRFFCLAFIFSQSFSGIFVVRSSIAYMLCLLAFCQLLQERHRIFAALIIIASLFHVTALLFLLIYPVLSYKGKTRNVVLVAVIVSLALIIGSEQLVPILQYIVQMVKPGYIVPGSFHFSTGLAKWLFVAGVLLIAVHFTCDALLEKILRAFSIGLVLYVASMMFSPYAYRLAGCFLNVAVVAIPLLFQHWSEDKLTIASIGFSLFCALSLYNLLNGDYAALYVPYYSIFDTNVSAVVW